ncbi:MAG: hypothetical protein KQH57_10515 [Actinomycetales bacterium]|nr:hypothetical protein [Actinomycetales bacterium]
MSFVDRLTRRVRTAGDDRIQPGGTVPHPALAGDAVLDQVVAPRGAPTLPEGWTYRFSSPGIGEAQIVICDPAGRPVTAEPFVGHARSPEIVLATACGRAFARWEASGAVVGGADVRVFTASAGEEGDGWRVWCNQALVVSFLTDDLSDAEARMAVALAQEMGLDPAAVRVTLVPSD